MGELQFGLLIVLVACLCAGAISDILFRRIPNWMCIVTAVLGMSSAVLGDFGGQLLWQAASLVLALAAGMAVYALKFWGGGDAKFFAGTAAWFALSDLGLLVLAISLAGLALTLVWLVWNVYVKKREQALRSSQIPYGVAIAAGGIITAIMT